MEAKPDATSFAVWGPDHEHAAVLVAKVDKTAMMLMKNKGAPEVFAEAVDQGGQIGVTDGRDQTIAMERAALNISGSSSGFSIFHVVNGHPESRLSFSKLGGGLELRTPGGKAVTRVIGAEKEDAWRLLMERARRSGRRRRGSEQGMNALRGSRSPMHCKLQI